MASESYEVRCESCQTSFAPETKRCIHCGAPLGGGLAAILRQRPAARAEAGGAAAGHEPDRAPVPIAEEDEEQLPQAPGRSLLWVITAIVAVGISMLRACMEG